MDDRDKKRVSSTPSKTENETTTTIQKKAKEHPCLCEGKGGEKEGKENSAAPRFLARSADLLVRNVTPLEETITDSAASSDQTAAHEHSNRDQEALTRGETFLLRRRGKVLRKLLTLSNGHTEEALSHNMLISTSDEDVEELILNGSEGDLSLRRAVVIVVVVDTDLTTVLIASKVNLDLSGKVSHLVASGDSDPVVITDDLVPVTLARNLLARSVGHITVSGKSIIEVRKAADTNGSPALSVDHRLLLVNVQHKDTRAAGEASDKDPVVGTRGGHPLDLRRTAARWVIIIDLHAVSAVDISLIGAVVVELEDSIIASVLIAGGGDKTSTSTNDRNPNTLLALVLARAERLLREHGVVLNTPWESTTLDEVSVLASAVLARILLVEINVEVSSRVLRIRGSDEDVISPAVLSNESSIGAIILRVSVSNAAHLIAIVVNLDASLELVELVAGGGGDGLAGTIVSVTPPATTTLNLGTIARLFASIIMSGVAEEHIREAVDILSEPALRVLGVLIRHDGKGEGDTVKGRGGSGDSNVVRVRSGKEDDLGTKTAVIIVRSNASHTRTVVLRVRVLIAVRVHIDDGIVDSGRASASGDDHLTVVSLDTEVHCVNVLCVTALREGGVTVVSLTVVVVGDGSDDNSLIAIAVGVEGTLLDGKSEAATSVVVTSHEDPVVGVHSATPRHHGSTIASIVVMSDTISSTVLSAVAKHRDGRIVVGVGVASVGKVGFTVAGHLVPQTSAGPAPLAAIPHVQASASLTIDGEGEVLCLDSLGALIVVGGENLRGSKVEDTSGVQEASDVDVVILVLLSSEHDTGLPLVAAIIIHGKALVDVTALLIARGEHEDHRVHSCTLIASIEDDSLVLTLEVVPDTLRAVLVSLTLHSSGVEGSSITLIQFVHNKVDGVLA